MRATAAKHVEQHAVDRLEHAACELVAVGSRHHPRRREIERHNTHAALQPLASVAQPAAKGKLGAITGDAYTASRLLFPADWAPMAKAQDGVLVIALPRPTTILYIGDMSPNAVATLRKVAHEQMAGAPDALSDQLLRWTPEGWTIVN